jgi:catechol 2,3-dioxygenase-like lactoylglutathione lyase family enzyme
MSFTYTGIRVQDLRRSLTFYTKVLGFKKVHRGRMRAGGIFVQLKQPRSSQVLELNYYPRRTKYYERFKNGSELDHLGFWERDVDRKYGELLANGGSKAVEPFSEGGYRLAFAKDPDGIWIELLGKDITARRKVH